MKENRKIIDREYPPKSFDAQCRKTFYMPFGNILYCKDTRTIDSKAHRQEYSMVLLLFASFFLATETPATYPKYPFDRMGDSTVSYSFSGVVDGRTRIFYNKNGWIDSIRVVVFNPDTFVTISYRYSLLSDTLIQSTVSYGKVSSETMRYLYDNSYVIRKQLYYSNDTPVEIDSIYYNQAGKLSKQIAMAEPSMRRYSDSIIFVYDGENHLVSSSDYLSMNLYYIEFEHDQMGRVTKRIKFKSNSTTQKTGAYEIFIYLSNNSFRDVFADAPKKPAFQVDRFGTIRFLAPTLIHEIRVFDVRGVILRSAYPYQFTTTRQNGLPGKTYFIKASTNEGTITGKKTVVR
jgi:hypothetical protein